MKYYVSLFITFALSVESLFADKIKSGVKPDNSLIDTEDMGLIEVLSFAEGILLKAVLPLVIVGTALYVAYELFLAEGNEEKMKKAWKMVTYASVGVIAIALAYSVISLVSRLSL